MPPQLPISPSIRPINAKRTAIECVAARAVSDHVPREVDQHRQDQTACDEHRSRLARPIWARSNPYGESGHAAQHCVRNQSRQFRTKRCKRRRRQAQVENRLIYGRAESDQRAVDDPVERVVDLPAETRTRSTAPPTAWRRLRCPPRVRLSAHNRRPETEVGEDYVFGHAHDVHRAESEPQCQQHHEQRLFFVAVVAVDEKRQRAAHANTAR